MKTFYYAQGNSEDLRMFQRELETMNPQIEKTNIYLDTMKEEKWKELKHQMQAQDRLYISSIKTIAMDTNDFKEKLQWLETLGIQVVDIQGEHYQLQQLLDTLAFVSDRGMYMRKQKQKAGIQKALRQKQLGKGRYGRPKTIVPEDFEENIRKVMKKQMSHETYRQRLDMKRSTYFKLVKDLRASWIQKE